MWNRRYLPAVVFLLIVGLVLLQPRSQEYTKSIILQHGRKRTSKLHLLVPASNPHVQLCRALVSSAILGYPPAVLSGWNGTGDLDASITHLAKVRNVVRYLDSIPPSDDDDLILIIDGYDVIMQLPAEIMIQRYFAVTEAANAKLAARFGDGYTSLPHAHRPRQSILFGPDKLCWPVDFRRPACFAAPETGLPKDAFGIGDDDSNSQPRWLNSGTIMGPVGSMREMFAATIDRIQATYDPEYICRESDQMYMSDVWGEQEYARSMREFQLKTTGHADEQEYVPDGGVEEKWIPDIAPGQKTEYQIGLDYESSLFQSWAGYERFLDLLPYNGTNYTALVTQNVNDAPDFKPYEISLPTAVTSSLAHLLSSVSRAHNTNPFDLVTTLHLGTNLVTRHVYGLFHCTGEKGYLDELWGRLWFYPYAKELLSAAITSVKSGADISTTPVNGRLWKGAKTYPATPADVNGEVAYGAWADLSNEWLDWGQLCREHEGVLFGEEQLT
ncbi:hypothetical protein F503_01546 [Ophiostoma piceae UAMH 11346]|uniref:Uncharacterized protein n=1 Tax=Ophiostoma piceae (strain UAMH 11346) TaxID=1262450 RepID=S3CQA3_OPHP1|nr:hypothetical protein F503_01546 [Ophiostoma piceae UAMH 11346]